MSHPDPSREYGENEHPESYRSSAKIKKMAKKVNYTGKHAHSHSKGGLMGELKGLQGTKHFGAKRRTRHKMAQRISKGEDVF
jgi:hypothetical protein